MKVRYIILTILYCAGIFWLSSQSRTPESPAIPFGDKIAHAILYAGLAFIISFGIRRSNKRVKLAIQFAVPVVFATLYGITDEFHQLYVPDRSSEFMDIMADFTGAAVIQCVLCWYFVRLDAQSTQSEELDVAT